jgi:methionine-rich copper-binding protein CopC
MVVLCLAGSPASAHVTLSAASPEPESTASGAPGQVQLKFVVPAVADPRTLVSVVAPSGRDLANGATTVTDLGVGQALFSSDETGWYRVSYRVVLWGGHVDEGRFRFYVEPAGGASEGPWLWGVVGLLLVALLYGLHVASGRRDSATTGPRPAGEATGPVSPGGAAGECAESGDLHDRRLRDPSEMATRRVGRSSSVGDSGAVGHRRASAVAQSCEEVCLERGPTSLLP